MKLLLVYILVLIPVNALAIGWNTETVHDPVYIGMTQKSLVIGADGYPHIFYGGTKLVHSFFDGSQWQTEVLDDNGLHIGLGASAAIDPNGFMHVIYSGDSSIKYATNKSGAWTIETITADTVTPNLPFIGLYSSLHHAGLAVDSGGYVHIAFIVYDQLLNYDHLYYLTNSSLTWTSELVDVARTAVSFHINGGGKVNVLVDSTDKIHIIYPHVLLQPNNSYPITVNYATNSSGVWETETVSALQGYPWDTAAAIDSSGVIHLAAANSYTVYYVNNSSGSWSSHKLTPDSSISDVINNSLSMNLDAQENVHIVYGSCTDSCSGIADYDLLYTNNANGTWQSEQVNSQLTINASSIEVDANRNVNIAYTDSYPDISGYESLYYASDASNSWEIEHIYDGEISESDYLGHYAVGMKPDIAEDSNGNIHLVYGGDTTADLIYASNVNGQWEYERLPPHYFDTASIVVDTFNKPHVIVASGGSFLHYYKELDQWVRDDIGYLLPYECTEPRVVIDDNNIIHIAYYDEFKLKYAHNTNGAWQIETLVAGDKIAHERDDCRPSLYVDKKGSVHIGFINYMKELSYITNKSGEWDIQILASPTREHYWLTYNKVLGTDYIVLPNGIYHMVYRSAWCDSSLDSIYKNCYGTGIEYMSNSSGEKTIDTVEYFEDVSYRPILAIDKNGALAINYIHRYDTQTETITQKVATKFGNLWRVSALVIPKDQLEFRYRLEFSDTKYSGVTFAANGDRLVGFQNPYTGTLELSRSYKTPGPKLNIEYSFKFNITRGKYDFGKIGINTTESTEIRIENIGTEPLEISDILADAGDNGYYSSNLNRGSKPCGNSNVILAVNDYCTAVVNFTPSSAMAQTYTYYIFSNDPEIPIFSNTFMGFGVPKNQSDKNATGGGGNFFWGVLMLFAVLCLRHSPKNGVRLNLPRFNGHF